jgi:hypothetical protein
VIAHAYAARAFQCVAGRQQRIDRSSVPVVRLGALPTTAAPQVPQRLGGNSHRQSVPDFGVVLKAAMPCSAWATPQSAGANHPQVPTKIFHVDVLIPFPF